MSERFSRRALAARMRSMLRLARLLPIYAPLFVRAVVRRRRLLRIAIFPMRMGELQPSHGYIVWKICAACGIVPCGPDPARAEIALAWRPQTVYEPDVLLLRRFANASSVINARCTDVRKSTVARAFSEVFGYTLEVDPLRYHGTVLRKSERNGAHDALLLDAPIACAEPGYVYQRLVSDPAPRGLMEYRVLIVGGRVTAAYRLYQPTEDRFRYFSVAAERVDVVETFTAGERARMAAFNDRMGLDLGALDVLRDPGEGRIYVIDCNPTATGPSDLLTAADRAAIIRDLATAFEAAYVARARTAEERTDRPRRAHRLRPTASSDHE